MRAFRSIVKRVVPRDYLQHARFLSRLPMYRRMDNSAQACASAQLPHGVILVSPGIQIRLPDHAIANSVFQSMAFSDAGQDELKHFLQLAAGCTSLVDLGASGGFFSAVFARSRAESSILSVELDRISLTVLEQTRDRNSGPNCKWEIDRRGVGAENGLIPVISSGYGAGVVAHEEAEVRQYSFMNNFAAVTYDAEVTTLETICAHHAFRPDIIKIDIESMEYEVVFASSEYLAETRPRLAFELHSDKLRARGKSPEELLFQLGRIGYKVTGNNSPPIGMLKSKAGVIRATLWV